MPLRCNDIVVFITKISGSQPGSKSWDFWGPDSKSRGQRAPGPPLNSNLFITISISISLQHGSDDSDDTVSLQSDDGGPDETDSDSSSDGGSYWQCSEMGMRCSWT